MTSPKKNILLIGMTNCVHLARWTKWVRDSGADDAGWQLHAFPSAGFDVHPACRSVTVHAMPLILGRRLDRSVRLRRLWWWPLPRGVGNGWVQNQGWIRKLMVRRLARLIDRLKPDAIHIIETQHAGYLYLDALRLCRNPVRAKISLSTMGSDVFYFHEVPYHRQRIERILGMVDLVHIDCERDRALVRELGYEGEVQVYEWLDLPEGTDKQAQPLTDPSTRRLVLVRGSDYWAVGGLTALAAVQQASTVLAGYEVLVYSAGPKVRQRVRELAGMGFNIRALRRQSPAQMADLFSRARVLLSVSRSDGTMVAMLEAMMMGCFPIVSENAAWKPWLIPGETGIVLKSEALSGIKAALESALTNDRMVDAAVQKNQTRILDHFCSEKRSAFVRQFYRPQRTAEEAAETELEFATYASQSIHEASSS